MWGVGSVTRFITLDHDESSEGKRAGVVRMLVLLLLLLLLSVLVLLVVVLLLSVLVLVVVLYVLWLWLCSACLYFLSPSISFCSLFTPTSLISHFHNNPIAPSWSSLERGLCRANREEGLSSEGSQDGLESKTKNQHNEETHEETLHTFLKSALTCSHFTSST